MGDINSAGYRRISLYYNNIHKRYFVHRLVAFYFCPGYMEGLVVNHIDGNKLNNISSNLEWVTRSENDIHAFKLGLRKVYYIPNKPEYLIKTYDLNTNTLINLYRSKQEFALENNRSVSSIQEMVKRGYFENDKKDKIGICRIKPNEVIKPIIFTTKS